MAIYANIPIDQGTDFSSVISVLGADGLAYDLTGYTARGQIRKSYTSSNSVTFTCAVQSPGTEGKIQLTLTSAQTGAMKAGRYLFDIEIVEIATGAVSRVVQGQVEVNPRVTHIP
jgi:hypothetical protein